MEHQTKSFLTAMKFNMRDTLRSVQVHVPFHRLRNEFLPLVVREGINPEIGFNHFTLDHFEKDDFVKVANHLLEAELTVSFHAPFMDLRPGAIDPEIRKVTAGRLQRVFDLVPYFRPISVVCHASFDKRYYVSNEQEWLSNSIETWGHFLQQAVDMGTMIAIENVYETDCHYLRLLLNALVSPHICFCFDTGHFNVYSTASLEEWVNGLAPRIGQVHIHDNNGLADEHLPTGEGNFPFKAFFEMIHQKKLNPIITLEPHSENNLWRTLENIEALNLFGK